MLHFILGPHIQEVLMDLEAREVLIALFLDLFIPEAHATVGLVSATSNRVDLQVRELGAVSVRRLHVKAPTNQTFDLVLA